MASAWPDSTLFRSTASGEVVLQACSGVPEYPHLERTSPPTRFFQGASRKPSPLGANGLFPANRLAGGPRRVFPEYPHLSPRSAAAHSQPGGLNLPVPENAHLSCGPLLAVARSPLFPWILTLAIFRPFRGEARPERPFPGAFPQTLTFERHSRKPSPSQAVVQGRLRQSHRLPVAQIWSPLRSHLGGRLSDARLRRRCFWNFLVLPRHGSAFPAVKCRGVV